jgi:hypothetical protein
MHMNGQRFRVTAVFERWGTKRGWKGRTVTTLLLRDLRHAETGKMLTQHLWFTSGATWNRLGLKPGDHVAFDARATPYEKGYFGRRAEDMGQAWSAVDYRLERPTNARRIDESDDVRAADTPNASPGASL